MSWQNFEVTGGEGVDAAVEGKVVDSSTTGAADMKTTAFAPRSSSAPMSRFEKWSLGISISGFILQALGLYALKVAAAGINQTTQAIDANSSQAVSSLQMELNKTMVENYGYRRFFEDDVPLPQDEGVRSKALLLADLHIDFLEAVYDQSDHRPIYSSDDRAWAGWSNYAHRLYGRSRVIRDRLDEFSSAYHPSFLRWMQGADD